MSSTAALVWLLTLVRLTCTESPILNWVFSGASSGVSSLEEPVQPVGTGDDPDLVQQLHRLSLHVQIVQVQGGKLQLQVVKLKVRQILPGLLQQHLGVAHIVPVHRLRDPAMARHCLV